MEMIPMDDGAPSDKSGEGPRIPESFQERLEQYNRNFERIDGLLGELTPLESEGRKALRVEETKNLLSDALPIGVRTMIALAANADSESVRYKAAHDIIAFSLGKDPALQAEDPAMDLIARLQGAEEADPFSDES